MRHSIPSITAVVLFLFIGQVFAQGNGKVPDVALENVANALSKSKGMRLGWSPPPLYKLQKVYDRCDDKDAIESGLDGHDLDGSRERLGIDCIRGTGLRYAHPSKQGGMILSETIEPPAELTAETNMSEQKIPLGYWGATFDTYHIAKGKKSPIKVLVESISISGGEIRGLAINLSDSSARNVSVTLEGNSYIHPLSVMSGEAFPFILVAASESPNLRNIEFDYHLEDSIDSTRAIKITGSPGFWSGPFAKSPQLARIALNNHRQRNTNDVVSVFRSNLELDYASLGTEMYRQLDGKPVEQLMAIVAFYDDALNVTDIITPEIHSISAEDGDTEFTVVPANQLGVHDTLSVGFIVPKEAFNFSIWVGGSNK